MARRTSCEGSSRKAPARISRDRHFSVGEGEDGSVRVEAIASQVPVDTKPTRENLMASLYAACPDLSTQSGVTSLKIMEVSCESLAHVMVREVQELQRRECRWR